MTHVTCMLTAKNRHQLRNDTLGNRVWAIFKFKHCTQAAEDNVRDLMVRALDSEPSCFTAKKFGQVVYTRAIVTTKYFGIGAKAMPLVWLDKCGSVGSLMKRYNTRRSYYRRLITIRRT